MTVNSTYSGRRREVRQKAGYFLIPVKDVV